MAEKKEADRTYTGLTEDERAAMKERTTELKTEARRGKRAGKTDGEAAVREAIAKMQGSDQAMAERIHQIVKANAPALTPKTWFQNRVGRLRIL